MSTKSYRDAVALALDLGLVDDGIDGGGHHRFINAETGAATILSTTMADAARSVENARSALRRCAGVDSRGQDAREGERRTRRRLGRLASGFSLDAAVRESRRERTGPPPPPMRADLIREREDAYLALIAHQSRDAEAERLAARVIALDRRIEGMKP